MIKKLLFEWQSLIGSSIGAMTPFLLWWFSQRSNDKKEYQENLYFLERVLVDQINNVIEIRRVTKDFIAIKLVQLIDNIKSNNQYTFSLDLVFFPLFSVIPLSDELHKINTRSGYIDNKIAKSFQLSRDIPFIIDDSKKQFFSTIELNKDMVLNKVNPPEVQKALYLNNINQYKTMLEKDLLNINIPVYLKVLIQTREALNELKKIGLLRWRIRFDPKYRFYRSNKLYQQAKEKTYENIENFFEKRVQLELEKIQ